MVEAVLTIIRTYQELAVVLTQAHDIAYPAALERVMLDRLDRLQTA